MNRKGLNDLVIVMAMFMFLVVVSFLSSLISTSIYTGMNSTMALDNTTTNIINNNMRVQSTFLNSIPFIIIGIGLGAIVSAFFIPSHPAIAVISIIMLSVYTILATIFSNVVWEFLNVGEILAIANDYPLIVSIAVKLPYIITILGAIIIVVQCSKIGND